MKRFPMFVFLIFAFTGCARHASTTEPSSPALSIEDVSCTEAWVHLTLSSVHNTTVILKRDSTVLDTLILTTTDTTISDSGLLPSHTYVYTAYVNNATLTTHATTMDTTSHDFTWTSYTIGDASGGSSCLFDVAIINDTLAYAVGEFYRNDTAFNVAKWNGSEWELMRVLYSYNGGAFYNPIRTVFAFNASDIWFGIASLIHYNGTTFTSIQTPLEGLANKIWGTSSSDLYIVGNSGSIVHYNGSSWTKIESGTSLNINDIYGSYNSSTGGYEILCAASNIFSSSEKGVLQINGTTVQALSTSGTAGTLGSIWYKSGRKYYAGGDGIYEKNRLTEATWHNGEFEISSYYAYRIRGTDVNDLAIAGGDGELLHYSGRTWKSYYSQTRLNSGNYYSVAIKNHLIIAVGEDSPNAVLVMGKR